MAVKYGLKYLERVLSPKTFSSYSYGDNGKFYVKCEKGASSLIKKIKRCGLDAVLEDETKKVIGIIARDGPGLEIVRAYAQRHFVKCKNT